MILFPLRGGGGFWGNVCWIQKCLEDLITLESYVQLGKTMDNKFFTSENINIFGYLGAWGGFNTVTAPIVVHIYPLFNNNCMSNIESNLIRTFWVKIENIIKYKFFVLFSGLGPYIKSMGTRSTNMSVNSDLITVETYVGGAICTTRGNNLKTSFSYIGQNVQIFIFWAIFGALGVFNNQTRSILLISYPLTHIYVHVKYRSNLI